MIVDIHTHNTALPAHSAIKNLTLSNAEKTIDSNAKGLYSVGIHPWYIDASAEEKLIQLAKWANDARVIFIGECGLDKNSNASLQIQTDIFKKQIALSEKLQKPLIIHCVGGFNELFEIKERMNPKQLWIIHGFRGKPELAKQVLKNGCSLSFGEHFNAESIKLTPLEKLYIETDESSMSIEKIYSNIALAKGCSISYLTAGETLLRQHNII